jgi:hypothetical protein
MRSTGPFSQYNRYVIRYGFHGQDTQTPGLGSKSLLAGFAAQEARLLREIVIWSDCKNQPKPVKARVVPVYDRMALYCGPKGDPDCGDCCTMSHCETHHKEEGQYPDWITNDQVPTSVA